MVHRWRHQSVCRANRASTNSRASKSRRSSICSPMPMKRTGILISRQTLATMPPLAVPSSLVRVRPVTPTASLNNFAWEMPFCPVLASSTSMTSCGAPAIFLPMTRLIFLSSSIRLTLVCSRPAVSMMMTSKLWATPYSRPSKTTEDGSAPGFWAITSTPTRSPQILS